MQRVNTKLRNFSTTINEQKPSGYLNDLCQRLVARMNHNVTELQKNRLLNGPLLEKEIDNEIKKFDTLYHIVMDIYHIRENYNPKMPSSENKNAFDAFKANPDRKAVILKQKSSAKKYNVDTTDNTDPLKWAEPRRRR